MSSIKASIGSNRTLNQKITKNFPENILQFDTYITNNSIFKRSTLTKKSWLYLNMNGFSADAYIMDPGSVYLYIKEQVKPYAAGG